MTLTARDRAAAVVAAFALVLALGALFLGRTDPGVQIGRQGDAIVVQWVAPGSPAQRDGVLPGMVVTELNGVQLMDLPHYPPGWSGYDENGNPAPTQPPVQPARPTPVGISDDALAALLRPGIRTFSAIQPWDLERGSADNWNVAGYYYSNDPLVGTTFPFAAGVVLLVTGAWWLRSGRAGAVVQPLALPLALAVATPFLVRPIDAAWMAPGDVAASVVLVLGLLPLAHGLTERVEAEIDRRLVGLATTALAVIAVLGAVAVVGSEDSSADAIRWVLGGAIPLLPGIAAAGPLPFNRLEAGGASSGRLLQSTEYAVAGATPIGPVAVPEPSSVSLRSLPMTS